MIHRVEGVSLENRDGREYRVLLWRIGKKMQRVQGVTLENRDKDSQRVLPPGGH